VAVGRAGPDGGIGAGGAGPELRAAGPGGEAGAGASGLDVAEEAVAGVA
jgi:hypothetical protein